MLVRTFQIHVGWLLLNLDGHRPMEEWLLKPESNQTSRCQAPLSYMSVSAPSSSASVQIPHHAWMPDCSTVYFASSARIPAAPGVSLWTNREIGTPLGTLTGDTPVRTVLDHRLNAVFTRQAPSRSGRAV